MQTRMYHDQMMKYAGAEAEMVFARRRETQGNCLQVASTSTRVKKQCQIGTSEKSDGFANGDWRGKFDQSSRRSKRPVGCNGWLIMGLVVFVTVGACVAGCSVIGRFVDVDGDRWFTDEYGDMAYMWEYQ